MLEVAATDSGDDLGAHVAAGGWSRRTASDGTPIGGKRWDTASCVLNIERAIVAVLRRDA